MAGRPFKVGRFAHSLRVRLMREHLGVDVDSMYEEDLMANEPVQREHEVDEWDPDDQQEHGQEHGVTHIGKHHRRTALKSLMHDTIDEVEQGEFVVDFSGKLVQMLINALQPSTARETRKPKTCR